MNSVPMRILLVAAVFFLSNFSFAAPEPPPPTTPPPPGLPIDGGLVIMVVLGLLFGAYKIYQHKKRVAQ
jgi:hypothetical protein